MLDALALGDVEYGGAAHDEIAGRVPQGGRIQEHRQGGSVLADHFEFELADFAGVREFVQDSLKARQTVAAHEIGDLFFAEHLLARVAEPVQLGVVHAQHGAVDVHGMVAAGGVVVEVEDFLGGFLQGGVGALAFGDFPFQFGIDADQFEGALVRPPRSAPRRGLRVRRGLAGAAFRGRKPRAPCAERPWPAGRLHRCGGRWARFLHRGPIGVRGSEVARRHRVGVLGQVLQRIDDPVHQPDADDQTDQEDRAERASCVPMADQTAARMAVGSMPTWT